MSEIIDINARLEALRAAIKAENISYGELAELQGYGEDGVIPEWDVELLEWAGVPEFPEPDQTYRVEIRFDLTGSPDDIRDTACTIAAKLECMNLGGSDYTVTGIWDENWDDVR